nr:hypothetical protein [uncultured archaeon]
MDSDILKKIIKGYFGRIVLNRNTPLNIIFFVTSKCNAKCKHCFNWKNIMNSNKRKELNLEEIDKISKNLKYLQSLTISGGEPFLRDDLDKIIELFYKNTSIVQVNIPTNGILTNKIEKLVENILKKCQHLYLRIGLSIDGLYKDHDNIRGYPGCFNNVISTYNKLYKLKKDYPNLIVSAAITISTFNKNKIKQIINYLEHDLKLDDYVLLLTYGHPRVKNAINVGIKDYIAATKIYKEMLKERNTSLPSKLFLYLTKFTQEVIVEGLINKKRKIRCYAGKKIIVIDDIGDVYPCEILNKKIGSLRKVDYNNKRVFNSKNCKNILNFINNKKCVCPWTCSIQNSLVVNPFQIAGFKLNNLFRYFKRVKNYFRL